LPRPACLAVAVCASLAAACGRRTAAPSPPDPNQIVATWSGGQFTRAEVDSLVEGRLKRMGAPDAETRSVVVKTLLARRARIQLLYREAVAVGIPERPEVQAVLRATEERALAEDWLNRHVAQAAHVPEAEVEKEAQNLARQAAGEELRRFSHIFLRAPEADPAARARARTRAGEIRHELAEGSPFDELARKYSDSITARGGGQVEWTARAPLHDVVAGVVFSLSEGQVSDPVETEMGLHIFRLDGIRRPTAPDLAALREDVRRRLDAEAGAAAIAAERTRTFETSGVRLDAAALSRPGAKDQVVAVVAGEPFRRDEFDRLRRGLHQEERSPVELARGLVVNRILAGKRRADPLDAEAQRKVDEARLDAVVDIRRRELSAGISTQVSDKDVAQFYEKNRDQAPALRDHVVDLLFFAQKGSSPAEVYAQGEVVSRMLRDGQSFDKILDERARERGTVIRRRLGLGDVDSLRVQNAPLARILGRLSVGEVSAPFYQDGGTLSLGGKAPVLSGKGLLFVRLVEVRPQPLEAVRTRLRESLQKQKESEAVKALIKKLDEQAGLKIVVANP
jgi:parvulin-like peptidyl-prolyl isomerase